MARTSRVLFSLSALMAFAFLGMPACTTFNPAAKDNKPTRQEPASKQQNRVPAEVFASLEVVVEACPIFLEPKQKSPTFGPLPRGEVVKRLDVGDNWVRVWIPRLLISGWVLKSGVEEIRGANQDQPPIPETELTTMIVVSDKINVREAPTTKSQVILVAAKNDEFFLLGEREGWCRVWVAEKKRDGWIFGKGLIRKTEK